MTDLLEGKRGTIGSGDAKIGGHLFYNGKLYVTAFLVLRRDRKPDGVALCAAGAISRVKGTGHGPFRAGSLGSGLVSRLHDDDSVGVAGGARWAGADGELLPRRSSRTSYGPSISSFDPEHLGTRDDAGRLRPGRIRTLGAYSGDAARIRCSTARRGSRASCCRQDTSSVIFTGRTGTGDALLRRGRGLRERPGESVQGRARVPVSLYAWAYDANDLAAVKAGTKQP